MNVIPFEPAHVRSLDPQVSQEQWVARMSPQYLENLALMGPAYSALLDDTVLGCAGIIDTGFDTGLLWAFVHRDAGQHFIPLFRAVRRLIRLVPLRRLEATCERGFLPSCRALELLGFQCEGLMKKYGPDGQDHFRYARL